MGEWFELDLTPIERKRMEVAAAKNEMSPEEWMSRVIRSSVALSERLGARMPSPESNPLDIRD